MAQRRPDPDELLRQVQQAEERAERGKLKIFLGASAGVGKTFAMLSEAHEQLDRGVDVAIGYVETHGRKETQALVAGLEVLPQREIEYKGVKLKEFDIDAALRRHPKLLIVDELAHTNAPESRHPKRYLDVEELLRSGIDVYTSINIQHLESLNDVVAQITGVQVRETIPDSLFDLADEVEVIDIPPKELIQRLKEGKVYVPYQVEHAIQGFFREGNLNALRELALRRTADRVDAQMESYRAEQSIEKLWPARERIMVCVAPNQFSAKLIRIARRMAESLHADVIAVYVESDRQVKRTPQERENVEQALKLAEDLRMETVLLSGHDIVAEVLRLAQRRNVTQIVAGKPIKSRWKEIVYGSVVDELVRHSGDINIHVITGEAPSEKAKPAPPEPSRSSFQSYAFTVGVNVLATGICYAMFGRAGQANLIMVYLLASAFVSSRYGLREAVVSCVLGVAAFDFFFVQPLFSFSISDTQYLLTFAVMLGVSLLISSLTQKMRRQADYATARERRTAALYTLSRQLVRSRSKREISKATCENVRDVIECDSAIYMPDDSGKLMPMAWASNSSDAPAMDTAVAEWSMRHGESAGFGTDTLPGSDSLYLALKGAGDSIGVLAIKPARRDPLDIVQLDLLQAFADQAAVALERAVLAKESQNARLQVETERLRNTLLSSVSHDLRTPLTAIAGAASTLRQGNISKEQHQELVGTIYDESGRLNRLVRNLLDMTRLESGELKLNLEWQSAEELVGSAVRRTEGVLVGHRLKVEVEPDLPLLKVDGPLIEQVLINLLENAGRHSPAGSIVDIKASKSGGFVRFEIADNGPGIPIGEEEKIFDKFQKAAAGSAAGGFGLGLAICRGILKAHGSQIWARHRPGGGVLFVFELQASEAPVLHAESLA